MGICYIFGASPITDYSYININIKKDDFVICADGGYKLALNCGIKPNLYIGDFDSQDKVSDDLDTIKLIPEKDDTDIQHSLNKGLELGYREFVLFGAIGGRFDHTMANIQLLVYALKNNAKATIYDDKNIITVMSNEEKTFEKLNEYKYISIFSHTDVCTGVCLKGMKYPLEDATITNYSCGLTVSNEILDDSASIKVDEGILIVIRSKD